MPPSDRLLAFLLTSLVIVLVPGPSVLFTVGRALTIGRRGALRSVAGNALGAYLQVIAGAVGVGTLVARSSEVYAVVKFGGAAYLIYLGVQAFRHRHEFSDAVSAAPRAALRSPRRQFLDALAVGVSNPKTIVFFSVALPQFADRSAGHVPLQLLVLGALFTALALVCDSGWALVAGTAREWFVRSPRQLSTVGGAGGLAIVGLGVSVAVTGRKD